MQEFMDALNRRVTGATGCEMGIQYQAGCSETLRSIQLPPCTPEYPLMGTLTCFAKQFNQVITQASQSNTQRIADDAVADVFLRFKKLQSRLDHIVSR